MATAFAASRIYMLLHLGLLNPTHKTDFQDLNVFKTWATGIISSGAVPTDAAWQYPPGALLVFLPPLLAEDYFVGIIAIFLTLDAIAFGFLVKFSFRTGMRRGVWVWIALIPMLSDLPLLRFDLIPTAVVMIAMTLPSSRFWHVKFGFLAAFGFMLKIWPMLILLMVKSRKFVPKVAAVFAITCFAAITIPQLFLGNSLTFLGNQSTRGLGIESVSASGWYLKQAIFGTAVNWIGADGSLIVNEEMAFAISATLRALSVVALLCAFVWWLFWTRGLSRLPTNTLQRDDYVDAGRDAVLVATLILMVLSPVLSPQFMIWLVGVCAVILTQKTTLVMTPAVIALTAVLLTQALLGRWGDLVSNGADGAYILVARNLALLVAAAIGVQKISRTVSRADRI